VKPSTFVGAIFLLLAAYLLVGGAALRSLWGQLSESAVAIIGVAWAISLWGAFVAAMLFLILWVTESGADRAGVAEHETPTQPVAHEAPPLLQKAS
jgi:hypothetical protein